MHRGMIISFIQAVFSAIFYFAAIAIYNVSSSSASPKAHRVLTLSSIGPHIM